MTSDGNNDLTSSHVTDRFEIFISETIREDDFLNILSMSFSE